MGASWEAGYLVMRPPKFFWKKRGIWPSQSRMSTRVARLLMRWEASPRATSASSFWTQRATREYMLMALARSTSWYCRSVLKMAWDTSDVVRRCRVRSCDGL